MNPIRRMLLADEHVCPWWLAYSFDNPLRKIFHKPENIFEDWVKPGDTALDFGCGMGFFSIGIARMVGSRGKVYAADIQQKMLDVTEKRAVKAGVVQQIERILCEPDRITVPEKIRFALAFWVVHEVPDPKRLFREVFELLVPGGIFLMAEPRIHVPREKFIRQVGIGKTEGFILQDAPDIRFSRTMVFRKS